MADAGVLSAFGALLFLARERDAPGPVVRIAWGSLAAALLTTIGLAAWTADDLAGTVSALPAVLRATLFGNIVLVRLGLLALAAAALGVRARWAAAGLAGLAAAALAGHGHALAMDVGPSWLLGAEMLHVVAAGAWLGGVLPLAILVAGSVPDVAAAASRRFAPLGTACVVVIAGTALFQGSILIGSASGLLDTPYGRVALFKAAGLVVLLGFAARHRLRLVPALAGVVAPATRRSLYRSMCGETAVGVLVVLAAGVLASLQPSMSMSISGGGM